MTSLDEANHEHAFAEPQSIENPQVLRSRLRADLIAAMKSRQPDDVTALRTALAAIDNAEAVTAPNSTGAVASSDIAGAQSGVGSTDVQRRTLSIAEVHAILKDQIDDRIAAADLYDSKKQHDAAERLRREACALTRYLAM